MPGFLLLSSLLLLSACATMGNNGGWHGENAQPFDASRDKCEAESASVPKGDPRRQAFEACMAGQGWHRR